MPRGKKGEEKR